MKIYAISGLGADERVFRFLSLDIEIIHVQWIEPHRGESIEDYALRLSKKIDNQEKFVLLGVSFGGLLAVEISKILKPQATILISSVAIKTELRLIYRIIGKSALLRLVPYQLFNPPKRTMAFLFDAKNKELLYNILDDTDPIFAKWALMQLVNWSNITPIKNCFKIGGTKDKLIPSGFDTCDYLIEDGGHFMIVDEAKKISIIINNILVQ